MTLGKIATMEDYAGHLSDHPDEAGLLQKDLLIGVTDFFRQPQAWETLEQQGHRAACGERRGGRGDPRLGPRLLHGQGGLQPGHAAGRADREERREDDFQIFATDADFAALATARTGSYTAEEIGESISAERLKRFFSRRDGRYQVIKSIRERIVFAAQNLTADPPFSRLDLIICRNLLIYLDQQVQRKIIALFHFALREGGFSSWATPRPSATGRISSNRSRRNGGSTAASASGIAPTWKSRPVPPASRRRSSHRHRPRPPGRA